MLQTALKAPDVAVEHLLTNDTTMLPPPLAPWFFLLVGMNDGSS